MGAVMREYRFVRWLALLGFLLLVMAQPARATRTVFDTWGEFRLSGYCSPNSAATAGCAPYAMPFSVQMGGNTYNSFYVNSNGTASFGSIGSFLAPENSGAYSGAYTGPPPQTSLAAYSVPVFSPNFSDGPGHLDDLGAGYDGNFVAITSVGSDSFTVNWFPCSSGYPLTCGAFSMNLVASATYNPADLYVDDLQRIILNSGSSSCPCTSLDQQFAFGQQNLLAWMMNNLPVYTMTLTDLSDGFRVEYSYNPAATGQPGVYGFSLPSGLDQTSGPLQNRSYLFDSLGHLVAVPEPATWMTLLLGFAMVGFAIRRKRPLQAA
jgi:hypothetical protein